MWSRCRSSGKQNTRDIWGQVHCEKNLQQQGYCEPRIHFSQTNKGWFTVVGDKNQLFNGGHKHTDKTTPLPVSGSQQPLVACDSL